MPSGVFHSCGSPRSPKLRPGDDARVGVVHRHHPPREGAATEIALLRAVGGVGRAGLREVREDELVDADPDIVVDASRVGGEEPDAAS